MLVRGIMATIRMYTALVQVKNMTSLDNLKTQVIQNDARYEVGDIMIGEEELTGAVMRVAATAIARICLQITNHSVYENLICYRSRRL